MKAITPIATNTDFEGEVKKFGDRVNIKSFLHDIAMNDYTAGTDMGVQAIVDTEEFVHINRRKYYNFPIDITEKIFDYVNDVDSALIKSSASILQRTIDTEFLLQCHWVKPGNWIGINQRTLAVDGGGGDGADTSASVATSATGGTITIDATGGAMENPVNGLAYRSGFYAECVGLPIRLVSSSGYSTEWWRIISVLSTAVITVENWDGRVQQENDPWVTEGDILYGLHGLGIAQKEWDGAYPTAENGWFYEIQAASPTSLTRTTVYNAICEMKQAMDENETPEEDRYLIINPAMQTLLLQASELQPDIAMYHEQTIVNGKVGRVAGFEVLLATGSRLSTRASRHTATTPVGGEDWANTTTTIITQTTGYNALACHKAFCTFANKWSESRVVDDIDQFAKLYQGLNLYGLRVPAQRRKLSSLLYFTT